MSDFALANKLASFKPKGWDVLPEPGDGGSCLCVASRPHGLFRSLICGGGRHPKWLPSVLGLNG